MTFSLEYLQLIREGREEDVQFFLRNETVKMMVVCYEIIRKRLVCSFQIAMRQE